MRWGRKGTGIYWEEKASQASVKELIAPGTFPKAELWPGGFWAPGGRRRDMVASVS